MRSYHLGTKKIRAGKKRITYKSDLGIINDKEQIALITGVTEQDGSCLVELLLEKGYKVHGIKRR
jgi:hypothetical protein